MKITKGEAQGSQSARSSLSPELPFLRLSFPFKHIHIPAQSE